MWLRVADNKYIQEVEEEFSEPVMVPSEKGKEEKNLITPDEFGSVVRNNITDYEDMYEDMVVFEVFRNAIESGADHNFYRAEDSKIYVASDRTNEVVRPDRRYLDISNSGGWFNSVRKDSYEESQFVERMSDKHLEVLKHEMEGYSRGFKLNSLGMSGAFTGIGGSLIVLGGIAAQPAVAGMGGAGLSLGLYLRARFQSEKQGYQDAAEDAFREKAGEQLYDRAEDLGIRLHLTSEAGLDLLNENVEEDVAGFGIDFEEERYWLEDEDIKKEYVLTPVKQGS